MTTSEPMLTCRETVAFLIDYFDGTLAVHERQRFDAHLAVCEACRAYLRTYEATIRMERHASAEDIDVPPEELVMAVLASRR